MQKGILITFEGIEGSGKSTHMRLAEEFLLQRGYALLCTYEPGGSPLGEGIRRLLLQRGMALSPFAELFLFCADRAQHLEEVILPALQEGKVVLCDRFADSTTAYQGYGRGIDLKVIEEANMWATGGLRPHLTILLDCDPEVGLSRVGERDRLEGEDLSFHRRVKEGYLEIARREPERVKVVVTNWREKEEVQREIRNHLLEALRRIG